MNRRIIIWILLLLVGCQVENDKKETTKQMEKPLEIVVPDDVEENIAVFDTAKHLENYQQLKWRISKYQDQIKNRNDLSQNGKFALAETYMSRLLLDSIFPYWVGTKWDFNGYTEKPRDGVIACGYFVSTTLRDLGIKLNRFKVAQKGASDIIYELCEHASIEKMSSLEKLIEFLENVREEEILIVGLDYHVGFIFKKKGEPYFAHSNYINQKGVEIELLEESNTLKHSNIYVIGNLTKNKRITENWIEK